MKTARPLDRHDPPIANQPQGLGDGIAANRRARSINQRQLGPTFWTAIPFRMQAPVVRPQILGLTLAAHGKRLEARTRTVVRQAAADRVTRSAMAAVGQRVAPTTTVRIEHLGQAITANGHVRTDHRRRTATPTVQNEKILGNRNGLRKPGSDGVDPRHRRRIVMQALQQRIHLLVTAADFEFDALRIVAHPASQPKFLGQTPDQRAETHPLHHAVDADALTNHARIAWNLHARIAHAKSHPPHLARTSSGHWNLSDGQRY